MRNKIKPFSLLHCHSSIGSPLDGMILFEELVAACQARDIQAVGLADHRSTAGWVSFDQALRPAGLNPIFGVEPDLVPDLQYQRTPEEEQALLEAAGVDATKVTHVRKFFKKLDRPSHITLLARTDAGVINLQHLITASHQEGWRSGKPCLDLSLLKECTEGLEILSGCSGGFLATEILKILPEEEELDPEEFDSAEDFGERKLYNWQQAVDPTIKRLMELESLEAVFPEVYDRIYALREISERDLWLELMPNSLPRQKLVNYVLYRIGQELLMDFVATSDCHYTEPMDALCQEVLLALQFRKTWKDADRFRFLVNEFGILGREEMAAAFYQHHPDLPTAVIVEALDNACCLGEECQAHLPVFQQILPQPVLEKRFQEQNYQEVLETLCWEQLQTWELTTDDRYVERLNYELSVIQEKGFANYLLVVRGVVQWARDHGIPVGPGRGSSAGSLVCWLLRITLPDPLENGLLFERFIDLTRNDMPDIDVDVADDRRHEIRRFLEETYGADRVAGLATHTVMGGKAAFRKVCSVAGVPLNDVNYIAQLMVQRRPEEDDPVMEETFTQVPEALKFKARYNVPPVPVVEVATRLEGRTSGRSTHAAGIVISDRPMADMVAMERRTIPKKKQVPEGPDHEFYVAYSKDDLASTGLQKIDLLGLKFLQVIDRAVEIIEKQQEGVKLWLESLPWNDEQVLAMLAAGHTIGVFQFETVPMRRMAMDLQVDCFEDLVAANALVRPGSAQAGAPLAYARRKRGQEEIPYLFDSPILRDILAPTYGLMLFQEQMMRILDELGHLDQGAVNKLRKAASKSGGAKVFEEYWPAFAAGCQQHRAAEEESRKLFDTIAQSGSYSFNRSHAVCYSIISYWTAWLKFHYAPEFLYALMASNPEKPERISEAVREAQRLGIVVKPPDLNHSQENFTLEGGKIWGGLASVKGVGTEAAQVVVALREGWATSPKIKSSWQPGKTGPFASVEDFQQRLQESGLRRVCNVGHVEKLMQAGCFNSLPHLLEPYSWKDKIRNLAILLPYPTNHHILEIYSSFLLTYLDGPFPDGQGHWRGEGFWTPDTLLWGRIEDFSSSTQGEEKGHYDMLLVDDGTPEWKNLKIKGELYKQQHDLIHASVKEEETDGAIVAVVRQYADRNYWEAVEMTFLSRWQEKVEQNRPLNPFEEGLMDHPFRYNPHSRLCAGLRSISSLHGTMTTGVGGWLLSVALKTQRDKKQMAILTLHDGEQVEEILVFGSHWEKMTGKKNFVSGEGLVFAEVTRTSSGSLTTAGTRATPTSLHWEKIPSRSSVVALCEQRGPAKQWRRERRERIPYGL